MKVIDTHCHPQFPQYDADRGEVLARAEDAGVGMVCVGTDLEMSRAAVALAEAHEEMWASVGAHPNDIQRVSADDFGQLLRHPKVVAIGEIGLDYYRTPDIEAQSRQREVFDEFLILARAHKKPIIVHCRDGSSPLAASAYEDLLTFPLPVGVIHSFTGTAEQAKAFLDRGMYIGLNGIVTFSTSYNAMVDAIPPERLLLETDSPYLAPPPHRGRRNEPLHVLEVARYIAKIRNISFETLTKQTTKNARTLFKI